MLREPADCLKSLKLASEGNDWQKSYLIVASVWDDILARYWQTVARMQIDPRVKTIRFEDLEDYATVAEAVAWLVPGMTLSRERFDLLNTLLIEPIPAKAHKATKPGFVEEITNLLKA